jgi:hypothetical protein
MSKERELLEKKMAEYNADTSSMTFAAHRHLKEQLAQLPREPLSEDEIAELWWNTYVVGKADSVRNFARAIEKAHGITGGSDEYR